MRSVKIQIRLRECAVWSESSLRAHVRKYVSWRNGTVSRLHSVFVFGQTHLSKESVDPKLGADINFCIIIWCATWEKSHIAVFDQRRPRSVCASTHSKMDRICSSISSTVFSYSVTLIKLRKCAGWPGSLLPAYEIRASSQSCASFLYRFINLCVSACVCVCVLRACVRACVRVCVCERERERERDVV